MLYRTSQSPPSQRSASGDNISASAIKSSSSGSGGKSGKSSSIVIVAEGDKIGKNVFELAEYIEENLPAYEVRVSVLGHIQRGGTPSCFDRVLASRMGLKAVESLMDGVSGHMIGIQNGEMILTPLDKAIKGKSKINRELIRVSDIMTL